MKKGQTQFLKERRLRRTSSRSAILGLFQRSSQALSYSVVEKYLSETFHRVTDYRSL